jgi:creatinine amidohydrolase
VRHVFGVPGGQTLALYDAILDRDPDLRHVLVRDERSAAYAADGYARVTGRAGVCDATVGPGAAKLPSGLAEALAASLGPVGVAHYHLAWPGTLTLAPGTLIAVFTDVCGGLAAAGARRILSVNWHEGNSATLRLAADEAQGRHGVRVVMAEAHVITHTLFPGEMEFTHAGSMETAAVLAFDPALVHLEDATPATDRLAGAAAHALFRRPDVYPVLRDFHDVAVTGWYGRPELATPERAEEIAEAVADHLVREAREIWAALGPAGEGR